MRKYPSVSPTVNANLSQQIGVMESGRNKTQGQNSWQPRAPSCKCTQELILLLWNQWDTQDVELEHMYNHRLSATAILSSKYMYLGCGYSGLVSLLWMSLVPYSAPNADLELLMQKKGAAVVRVGLEGFCIQESIPLPCKPQHNPPNSGRNRLSSLFLSSV